MRAACNKCGTRYRIRGVEDNAINVRIRCKRCGNSFEFQHFTPINEPRTPRGQWYFARTGDAFGPYTEGELTERYERGDLDEDTHVWTPAYDAWIPAMEHNVFATAIAFAKNHARVDGAQGRKEFATPIEELDALPEDPLYANDDTVELETRELMDLADRRVIFHDDMFEDDHDTEESLEEGEPQRVDNTSSKTNASKRSAKPGPKPKNLPPSGMGHPRRIPRPPKPKHTAPSPVAPAEDPDGGQRVRLAERLRRLRDEAAQDDTAAASTTSAAGAISTADGSRPVRVVTGKHAAISYDLPPRNPTPNPSTRSVSEDQEAPATPDACAESAPLKAAEKSPQEPASPPAASASPETRRSSKAQSSGSAPEPVPRAQTQRLTPLEKKLAKTTATAGASKSRPKRNKTTLLSPKPLPDPEPPTQAPSSTDSQATHDAPCSAHGSAKTGGKAQASTRPKADQTLRMRPNDLKGPQPAPTTPSKDSSKTLLISPSALDTAPTTQDIPQTTTADGSTAGTVASSDEDATQTTRSKSKIAPLASSGPSSQSTAADASQAAPTDSKSARKRWLLVAIALILALLLIGRCLWPKGSSTDGLVTEAHAEEAEENPQAQWTSYAIVAASSHLAQAYQGAITLATQTAEEILAQRVAAQEEAHRSVLDTLDNADAQATQAAERARAAEQAARRAAQDATPTPAAVPPTPKPVTDNTANQSNSLRVEPEADAEERSNSRRRQRRLLRRNR